MAEWLTRESLAHHLELPDDSYDDGSKQAERLDNARNATMELIDERTDTVWDDASTLPSVVLEAGLLTAARLHKRQSASFGIAAIGTADGGQGMRLLSKLDPDAEVLLAPYLSKYESL